MKLRLPLLVLVLIILLAGFSFFFLQKGSSSNEKNTMKYHLNYGGLERSYLLHIPPSHDNNTPLPLVVVLHGGGGSPENIEKTTGFSKKADEEGFIVVYPEGVGGTWNAGYCCGPAMKNQVDDVGFILKVIADVGGRQKIDQKRIYATGFSNGAMMSYRMACEAPYEFAAIASVSGAIGGKTMDDSSLYLPNKPSQPVSVIVFHGTDDQHVLYPGGHGNQTSGSRVDLSVNDSIFFWIEANKCSKNPIIDNLTNTVNRKTYYGGLNGTEVVLCTIMGGGHAWPGGERGSILGMCLSGKYQPLM